MNSYNKIHNLVEHIVQHNAYTHSFVELADSLNVNQEYLQQILIDWIGLAPKQFNTYLHSAYLKHVFLSTKHTSRICPLSNSLNITIQENRPENKNIQIYYSTFETIFGSCLVASTHHGISNILFFNNLHEVIKDLQSRWPQAQLICKTQTIHTNIYTYFETMEPVPNLQLHMQGTPFQIRVWKELLSIPEGHITTYGQIATQLGNKHLSQAVGTAIGNNPIGYIIPCHRVLNSTGDISGYRWGVMRKRVMLLFEAIKRNTDISNAHN